MGVCVGAECMSNHMCKCECLTLILSLVKKHILSVLISLGHCSICLILTELYIL